MKKSQFDNMPKTATHQENVREKSNYLFVENAHVDNKLTFRMDASKSDR